jgi:hypothetical protein
MSYNRDFNQNKDVDLAAGQQLYVKILSYKIGTAPAGTVCATRSTPG